jgi:hypothetical protein
MNEYLKNIGLDLNIENFGLKIGFKNSIFEPILFKKL